MLWLLIAVAVLLVGAVAVFILFCERGKPAFELSTDMGRLGLKKEIAFVASDSGRGVRSITIELVQGEKNRSLLNKTFVRRGLFASDDLKRIQDVIMVETAGLGFTDGRADLKVVVHDFSWWGFMQGNVATFSFPLIIDTKPPVINLVTSPRTIAMGGAGVVVYRLSEPVAQHGVTINNRFFPGFPLVKRGEGVFVAHIGIPHDMLKIEASHVTAVDLAGNGGRAAFGMTLKPIAPVRDMITLSDAFLDAKLQEFAQYYPEMTGNSVEKYIYINNTVREANAAKIREICANSLPERLWQGRFERMARSSGRAGFPDHRTYSYQGREIDKQVHLGVDLASVHQAEVQAANKGKVVFAEYLGIYGNTVILDHGQGVFTLYAHLSQIEATVDQILEQGGKLGQSGATGMAGGDHLHFAILINGVFVSPIEWWDDHWIRVNIDDQL